VKIIKYVGLSLLILVMGLCLSCAKKFARTEVIPYTPYKEEAKAPAPKAEDKAEIKSESAPPDKTAELDRQRKIKEESLREEALREKELREKALREETARKEALARDQAQKKLALESIYFDYDQWLIREGQKETMDKNAGWLKANPNSKVRVEGNCDERGTAEYNLALGQKRADAAKVFLEGMGISGNRIQTISYGFERPLDPGHDEAAWAKNRRVDFVPAR
jgi:peptidoglycan-associated lipoprotein